MDFNLSEMAVVAVVALLVIGPKDLPKAMRVVGYWLGRARGVARQFRQGFDTMIREAELEEMEKRWAEENARIMREHAEIMSPTPAALPAALPKPEDEPSDAVPVMVEQPVVTPAPDAVPAEHDPLGTGKAPS